MPQLGYNLNMDEGYAGMKADSRFDEVESFSAIAVISFGYGVARGDAHPETECRLPHTNKVVITDDGGTYTAGSYLTTVNGTLVTTTYDTDKATTLAAVATDLAALATIASAVYAGGSDSITIVGADDVELTISVNITGITGTMTISSTTHTSTDVVRGIALHTHQDNRTLPVLGASTYGATGYLATDSVNVLRKGVAWVEVADAVVENADVYLIVTGANQGKFTDDSSSPNIQVPTAKFRKATSAAGISKVEVNIP